MRISSSQFFQTGLKAINAQQADLMHLFQQIGSGQRMVTPADDPLAAAQSINIAQSQSLTLRYAENREVARRNLGMEEDTLTAITLQLQDIKTQLVQVGNGALSDADRNTLANALGHARSTLMGLANATDGNGQYLFSGSLGTTQPFDVTTGAYLGDEAARNIQVDQTRRLSAADVGSALLTRASTGVQRLLSFAGTDFDTALANTGTGVIGAPGIQDAALASADYRYDLEFTSSTQFTVSVFDVSQGAPGTLLDPADFPGMADWTQAQDFVPDQENRISLPFGLGVHLSGAPAADDHFGVASAATQDVNVFETLDALIEALGQPQQSDVVAQAALRNVLSTAMQRIDVNYDTVLTVRASVGARMNEIDALDDNGQLRQLGYRQHLSQLEDLDYYTAVTQLELRKTAFEAAAQAFRKIQGTSLFSMGGGG